VVYGFFFRPRAVEINAEEVALVRWDGKHRSIRRDEVREVDAGGSRIVLRGTGKALVIAPIFSGLEALRAEISAWRPRGEAQSEPPAR
jgi:hypothetical protein